MLALHLQEPWHRRAQAELLRIGGVDTTDHWLGHAFKRFASQTPAHEVRQALVSFPIRKTRAWQNEVERQAGLPRQAKNVAGDKGPKPRGREQMETFGHRTQFAAPNNKTAALLFIC